MFDQLPESSRGGHPSAPKVVAASVCGILLGFGLCGVDAYFRDGYGGALSILGAALFVVSVLVLVVTLFVLIVKVIISFFSKK